MITSPLRSRWQAHGELRIAVTSGPRHELLLKVELVLRMVLLYQKQQLQTGLQQRCCYIATHMEVALLVAHRSPYTFFSPSPTFQRELKYFKQYALRYGCKVYAAAVPPPRHRTPPAAHRRPPALPLARRRPPPPPPPPAALAALGGATR